MSVNKKTHAEIIAEMRDFADGQEKRNFYDCRYLGTDALRGWADISEAAHKCERGDCVKLREAISTLRTALKEIRDDVLDMVMNYKSEDPDSYAHGLCLSIGGACDMALNSTKEFGDANK